MSSWEKEKALLEERIAELELQLVETMERSANPVRSMDLSQTGRVKELEKQLAEASAVAERQLADAEAQWQKEEARLHLEVDRARKAAEKAATQAAPPPARLWAITSISTSMGRMKTALTRGFERASQALKNSWRRS
jgi:hypothetical protein